MQGTVKERPGQAMNDLLRLAQYKYKYESKARMSNEVLGNSNVRVCEFSSM